MRLLQCLLQCLLCAVRATCIINVYCVYVYMCAMLVYNTFSLHLSRARRSEGKRHREMLCTTRSICMHAHVRKRARACVCICMHIHIRICTHMRVYMRKRARACVCICIYEHIRHTHVHLQHTHVQHTTHMYNILGKHTPHIHNTHAHNMCIVIKHACMICLVELS